MNEKRDYLDSELDEIYDQIVDADSVTSPDILGARRVLELLNRAAEPESRGDTVANLETAKDQLNESGYELPLPEKIGRFEIRESIGHGGFGVVFRAYDPNLDREVALKVPRTFAALTPELRDRFLREGRAVASLAHPNIVPVFDSGNFGPICYLASQLVHGQSLADWVAQRPSGGVEPDLAAEMICTLAEAVEHAHQRGILHRDIKPGNVLIDENSSARFAQRIRLTDFGLAKNATSLEHQTATGDMIGTPSYMAPEQIAELERVGPASDVYGLGAVLYELLVGQPPFKSDTLLETINAVKTMPVALPKKVNPGVPADLEAICLKCLEKNPAERYSTAAALQSDLTRFLNDEPVQARKIGAPTRTWRWCKRNPIAAVLLGVLMFSAVAISLLWYRSEALRTAAENNRIAAEQRNELALKQTRQVRAAIKQLFQTVNDEPRLQYAEMEGFRKKLYVSASDFLQQLAEDWPEDPEYLREHVSSLIEGARLLALLGYADEAFDLLTRADEALQDEDSESFESMRYAIKSKRAEVYLNQGDAKLALELKKEVVDYASDLHARDRQFTDEMLARELEAAVWVAISTGNYRLADQYSSRNEEVLQRIYGKPPMEWPAERSAANHLARAAIIATNQRQYERAQSLAKRVTEMFEVLGQKDPGLLRSLAIAKQRLGITFSYQNKMDEAIEYMSDALELLDEPALADTSNGLRAACDINYDLALCYYKVGKMPEAGDCISKSIADAELLAQRFPQSFNPMLQIKPMHLKYGILNATKEFDAAELQLGNAIKYAERTIADNPEHRVTKIELAGMYANFSAFLSQMERLEESDQMADRALDLVTRLHEQEPNNVTLMHYTNALLNKAAMGDKRNRPTQELEYLKKYLDIAKHDDRYANMRRKLVYCYVAVERFDDAENALDELSQQMLDPLERLDLAKNVAKAITAAGSVEAPEGFTEDWTERALDLLEEVAEATSEKKLAESLKHSAFDVIRNHNRFPESK